MISKQVSYYVKHTSDCFIVKQYQEILYQFLGKDVWRSNIALKMKDGLSHHQAQHLSLPPLASSSLLLLEFCS